MIDSTDTDTVYIVSMNFMLMPRSVCFERHDCDDDDTINYYYLKDVVIPKKSATIPISYHARNRKRTGL